MSPAVRSLRPWLRALRPHHWSKNALLLLPATAAHLRPGWSEAAALAGGVAAFSLAASALYLVNDALDVRHDRQHPSKRRRPLAAGELSIGAALVAAGLFAAGAAAVAAALGSQPFQAMLAAYSALALAYSLGLKEVVIVDVVALGLFYTSRLVAGATLAAVPLSRWFLAFSAFFFFSLALMKRAAELRRKPSDPLRSLAGRGYLAGDLPVITAFGVSAGVAAMLVYCLYIGGEDVAPLYGRPSLLWCGLPILACWLGRAWVLTGRGAMHDDPVVFALTDPASWLALGLFLVAVWMAV